MSEFEISSEWNILCDKDQCDNLIAFTCQPSVIWVIRITNSYLFQSTPDLISLSTSQHHCSWN